MAPMSEKRGCACGVSLEKKIYVFGGTVDTFSRHARSCAVILVRSSLCGHPCLLRENEESMLLLSYWINMAWV